MIRDHGIRLSLPDVVNGITQELINHNPISVKNYTTILQKIYNEAEEDSHDTYKILASLLKSYTETKDVTVAMVANRLERLQLETEWQDIRQKVPNPDETVECYSLEGCQAAIGTVRKSAMWDGYVCESPIYPYKAVVHVTHWRKIKFPERKRG